MINSINKTYIITWIIILKKLKILLIIINIIKYSYSIRELLKLCKNDVIFNLIVKNFIIIEK